MVLISRILSCQAYSDVKPFLILFCVELKTSGSARISKWALKIFNLSSSALDFSLDKISDKSFCAVAIAALNFDNSRSGFCVALAFSEGFSTTISCNFNCLISPKTRPGDAVTP